MLHATTLLALLLTQTVAHVKDAKSPVDLVAEAVAQLPSVVEVDLIGEVGKALAEGRRPAPSAPLRTN